MSKLEDEQNRLMAAQHAIQTGVAYEHSYDPSDGSPKHLRVGVNSALCGITAVAKLLIDKGVITIEEYFTAAADEAENEVRRYEALLKTHYGLDVTLK